MTHELDLELPRTLGRTPWLLVVALLLHIVEEWPEFPRWATLHFGTTTPGFYLTSHIPIVASVVWIAGRAASRTPSRQAIWTFSAALVAFATNGVFHLGTTLLFRGSSPGLVTGVLLYLPLAAYQWPQLARHLGCRSAGRAALLEVIVSVLVATSLLIDMPRW